MEKQISEKSCLMIMPCLSQDDDIEEKFTIILLPHPQTNKKIQFVLRETDTCSFLYELNKHTDNPSSWLINNNFVKSDGSLFVVTPFDPLFILLSCLFQEKTGNFVLLDQLVSNLSDVFNIGNRILKCLKSKSQLNNIADFAGTEDFTAYKFNEVKTLKWLKQKVERMISKLKETNIFIDEQENITSEEALLQYACSMICDYIPIDLHQTLKTHLKCKETASKRKNTATGMLFSSKKAKSEPIEDYSFSKSKNFLKSEKKSLTKAQKALSKVDKKGMKTMSCFFKAKDKAS